MDQQNDEAIGGDIDMNDDGHQVLELGFEEAQVADGFAANLNQKFDQRPANIFQSMNQESNRFMPIDEIKLDLFKLQKKIDVKKLKTQLWTYIDPKVEEIEQNRLRKSHVPSLKDDNLKVSEVLGSLYGGGEVDSENISIHSAFICLLHIANEKGKLLWF